MQSNIESQDIPIIIKYEGLMLDFDFDMRLFEKSFNEFNDVFDQFLRAAHINGNLEVQYLGTRKGSLDVIGALHLTLASAPFSTPQDLFAFLQVMDPSALETAKSLLDNIFGVDKSINDYFLSHPFNSDLLAGFLLYMIGRCQSKRNSRKAEPYDERLEEIRKKNVLQKSLEPLLYEGCDSVSISLKKASVKTVVIRENNLENYVLEIKQPIPDYLNGQILHFTAKILGEEITNEQSVLHMLVYGWPKVNSTLHATLPYGVTLDLDSLDNSELVAIECRVLRDSMLEMPTLKFIKFESIRLKKIKITERQEETND